MTTEPTDGPSLIGNQTVKYLEGLTIHKVPYNIANTSDFKTNVMGKAADNELFIITDTPTFSLKIGNVTYDGTSNVSANTATQSTSGLMSAADKKKLDGIATGATKIMVDTSISSTSTNPVQNKVIKTELDKKAGTAVATTNANGLMSAADKTKLNDIATGANKTIVDTALSDSSTNPVQNKVIKTELDKKADNTALDAKADKTALDGKLDKTGGTLTGNLTGKYFTGTWLQTTAATDLGYTPGKVAVLDGSGWVYYRTPAEIKSDIGADAIVTTSSDGLMSIADKKKLDGIDTGANKITVDTSLSSTSTNPVQNKVVNSAISNLNTLVGNTSVSTQITNAVANKVDKVSGKGLSANDYTTIEKNKLAGISENAEVNQNAFSNVVVGSATISADSKTDTLTLVAGNNVTLTPDSTNDKITIAAKDTTYSAATTSSAGLMSASDKSKLDGIAIGATKITVDTALSSTSTNPVQNKVINSALGKKLNKSGGTLTGAITTKGIKLTSGTDFGSSLPSSMQSNQLFFQTLGSNYILDNVYPVGSIYMSVNSTNPKNLFGGTWEQIQGRFLFGMDSSYPAGSTGGEITHALTIDEMPEHNHTIYYPNAGGPYGNANISYPEGSDTNMTWCAEMCKTAPTGGGAAHNNMPPYLSVYIWKRTA